MSNTAVFPGISAVSYMSYLQTPGIDPGIAQIITPIEALTIANLSVGSLVFADGTSSITLTNCIPDTSTMDYTPNGNFVQVPILDRRWAWQYGSVSGWYNRKDTEGELLPSQKKNTRQLGQILVDAMGENNADVSALPTDVFPEVRWDADNPAQELQTVCNLTGCRITLDIQTDSLKIWRNGIGGVLPTGSTLIGPSINFTLIKKPSKVRAFSAPVLFEDRFELEGVGLEPDGTLVPVDDLSYKPDDGFNYDMWNVEDNAARQLAQESVYKYWRIKDSDFNRDVVNDMYSLGRLQALRQIQILPHIAQKDENDVFKEQYVFGDFYLEEGLDNPNEWNKWELGYRYDPDRRLIILSEPAYKMMDDEATLGKMYLHTAFTILVNETETLFRLFVDETVPQNPWSDQEAGIFPITKEEVYPIVIRQYPVELGEQNPTGVDNNVQDIQGDLQDFARREVDRFLSSSIGGQGQYVGLQTVGLDGLRDFVKWEFGIQTPFTTTVTINSKANPYLPSEERRRYREQIQRLDRLEKRRQNRRKLGRKIHND